MQAQMLASEHTHTRARDIDVYTCSIVLPGSKIPLTPKAETEPTIPSLLRALMAAVPQQEHAFVVAGEETLNKFDAQFVDRKWGQSQTTTFFLGARARAKTTTKPTFMNDYGERFVNIRF